MELTTEILPYVCAGCGGRSWQLHIGHRSDARTFLIITCADTECVEQRRQQIGAATDALVTWGEFDITGQGQDAAQHQKIGPLN